MAKLPNPANKTTNCHPTYIQKKTAILPFVLINYVNYGQELVRKLWFPQSIANWGIRWHGNAAVNCLNYQYPSLGNVRGAEREQGRGTKIQGRGRGERQRRGWHMVTGCYYSDVFYDNVMSCHYVPGKWDTCVAIKVCGIITLIHSKEGTHFTRTPCNGDYSLELTRLIG